MVTAINLSAPICRQHFFQCTLNAARAPKTQQSTCVTKFGSKPNENGAYSKNHTPSHGRHLPPAACAGGRIRTLYCMCWLPLIAMLAPVRNAASSLAR